VKKRVCVCRVDVFLICISYEWTRMFLFPLALLIDCPRLTATPQTISSPCLVLASFS
jgi:hypothetical protein